MSIKRTVVLGVVLASGVPVLAGVAAGTAWAQAAATSQRGTVKEVTGNSMTVTTDAGVPLSVSVPDGARLVQVAPGSTSLAGAQTITLSGISAGDKVLITGKAGDAPGSFSATRVILMKSADIAQKHAAEQADWQRRGTGGIVDSVDASSGAITFSAGAKKVQAKTTAQTIFRRYAEDSTKFEDATPGTLAQIQTGDQLAVRGAKSDDGASIQAEEIVSGSFLNLSGTIASVSADTHTLSLKDLKTKKTMTVAVTANSDLRKLPPEIAARFAARQRGGAPAAGGSGAPPAGAPPAGAAGAGGGRAAGMDLSRMLARLPNVTLADLHTGDAVMIVASQTQRGSDKATAVTVLGGVESILAAPAGSEEMTLSPWSVGGGAPEGGGGPN